MDSESAEFSLFGDLQAIHWGRLMFPSLPISPRYVAVDGGPEARSPARSGHDLTYIYHDESFSNRHCEMGEGSNIVDLTLQRPLVSFSIQHRSAITPGH